MGEFEEGMWATVFMVACYKDWFWTNKEVFEEGFVRPFNPCGCVMDPASMISVNWIYNGTNKLGNHSRQMIQVRWISPPSGWYKLNTDGAAKGDLGPSGCGGILLNDQGGWIAGFGRNIGTCTTYEAELWGVLCGFQFDWEKGIYNLFVECDSSSALAGISLGSKGSRGCKLLKRISYWKPKEWSLEFSLAYREGNRCADYLAN